MNREQLQERIKEEVILSEGGIRAHEWKRTGLVDEATKLSLTLQNFNQLVQQESLKVQPHLAGIQALKSKIEEIVRLNREITKSELEAFLLQGKHVHLSPRFIEEKWIPHIRKSTQVKTEENKPVEVKAVIQDALAEVIENKPVEIVEIKPVETVPHSPTEELKTDEGTPVEALQGTPFESVRANRKVRLTEPKKPDIPVARSKQKPKLNYSFESTRKQIDDILRVHETYIPAYKFAFLFDSIPYEQETTIAEKIEDYLRQRNYYPERTHKDKTLKELILSVGWFKLSATAADEITAKPAEITPSRPISIRPSYPKPSRPNTFTQPRISSVRQPYSKDQNQTGNLILDEVQTSIANVDLWRGILKKSLAWSGLFFGVLWKIISFLAELLFDGILALGDLLGRSDFWRATGKLLRFAVFIGVLCGVWFGWKWIKDKSAEKTALSYNKEVSHKVRRHPGRVKKETPSTKTKAATDESNAVPVVPENSQSVSDDKVAADEFSLHTRALPADPSPALNSDPTAMLYDEILSETGQYGEHQASKNGKKGLWLDDHWLVQPEYENVSLFSNDKAVVSINGQKFSIDQWSKRVRE